jgi:hypothetical protein
MLIDIFWNKIRHNWQGLYEYNTKEWSKKCPITTGNLSQQAYPLRQRGPTGGPRARPARDHL